MNIKIELSHCGEECTSSPDFATIAIGADIVEQIANARAMLELDLLGFGAEIVLSMPDTSEFSTDCGDAEAAYDPEPGAGDFEASNCWLNVGRNAGDLRVTYWEENTGDELVGVVEDPELIAAIARAMPAAAAKLKRAIDAYAPTVADISTP